MIAVAMKLHRTPRDAQAERPTVYVGDHTYKLGRVATMRLDEDYERPCREDLDYGQTLFTRAPPLLPRFLRGRSKDQRPRRR